MKASRLLLLSGILSASAFVAGCSSSDDDGGTTTTTPAGKATITTENYKDLAVAATEGSKRATSSNSSSGFAALAASLKTSNKAANKSISSPLQELIPGICENNGTADISGLDSIDQNSTSFSFDMTFTNCLVEGATVSGSASVTSDISGSFSATYTNFQVTVDGETETLNGTITCDSVGNCEENLSFGGELDGRTYETEGMEVTGNATDGFNVSGTVTDPTHGEIDIVVSGVTFNCSGGQPGTGSVTITGEGGATATVTFDGCDEFTVTFDGVSETFLWSTI